MQKLQSFPVAEMPKTKCFLLLYCANIFITSMQFYLYIGWTVSQRKEKDRNHTFRMKSLRLKVCSQPWIHLWTEYFCRVSKVTLILLFPIKRFQCNTDILEHIIDVTGSFTLLFFITIDGRWAKAVHGALIRPIISNYSKSLDIDFFSIVVRFSF